MAVRFVIGRAGTGKTHHCLEAVRRRLREDPIDGPRLVMLVPEQASLQMERAILAPGDIYGAHRAEVLSFQRLAYKVLDSTGAAVRTALSEPARVMVLRHLLATRSNRLQYYRRVDRLGGFIDRLGATISELIQEAVEPDQLTASAERADPDNAAQRAKLHDLHLIYTAYLEYLGDERLDPSQYLQVAREHLPRCAWLHEAEVWVDGFASLSGQETLALVELARICETLEITLLMDPARALPGPAGTSDMEGATLFRKIEHTYRDLSRAFVDAGVPAEEPLLLEVSPPPRFNGCTGLARLERLLFRPLPKEPDDAPDPPAGLELVELPSRRVEVDYAVARVCRWVQEAGLRYRDIAIIVRNLDVYHDLVSEALAARGIPFFIDRRRPIAHHPLVELLRAGTMIAAEPLSLESVRLMLKTGLLPLAMDAVDELENYLLAHGIAGSETWQGGDWSYVSRSSFAEEPDEPDVAETARLARVNETRRAFLRLVEPWLEFATATAGHSGPAWATAIIEWLERLHVGETLGRWAQTAEADGDLDQAAEHEQVFRDTGSFLEDLSFAFTDVSLSTEELAGVLETGLAGLTLGLAPPMIDQLLVGSIERSRHPDIKAAVILGFNDGIFPKQLGEDSILNDDDRRTLRDTGVRIGPPTRERILDEAALAYIAVTRAGHCCVVTYATADNDGKVLRPSPYVEALRRACPTLRTTVVGDPCLTHKTWDILSPRDVVKRLVMEFRTRNARTHRDQTVRGRWNALYEAARASMNDQSSFRRALAALEEPEPVRLSPASTERLYSGPLRTSVSQLETYATCPFQYFARYGLRLRERAEAKLAPVDVGQVHHAVLEDLLNTLARRPQPFAQLDEAELLGDLQESCGRIATRLPPGGTLADARNAYLLRRSAAQLARVIRAQRKVSQSGTARPRAAELPFGFNRPGSLPAVEISTPAGRRVELRGFIDRVDLAEMGDELLGIVIDYKRTRDKHLNLGQVYHGLSLQLLGYLLALAESGQTLAGRPVRPVAALYVSLAPTYHLVDHPALADSRDTKLTGTYRPRGLVSADGFDALDQSAGTGWSEYYGVYRKRDGALGHLDSSDAAEPASFRTMLDHTRRKLGQLADGILDGYMTVSPYRLGTFSPCSWCALAGVCRFEMGISDVRFLETLTRSEVFRRLAGASGKGNETS